MRIFRTLLLCLLLFLQVRDSLAQDKDLQALKTQYLKLRNTDVEISDSERWLTLAAAFEDFVEKNPKSTEGASALLDASILYERLYRKFGGHDRLEKCVELLTQIPKRYPGHKLSDDALLRLGDIQLQDLDDKDAARRSYQEIVEAYPDGDMFDAAHTRLDQIKSMGRHAKREAESEADAPSPETAGKPVIVLDPGHGGEDYGAPGVGGILEKDVVLDVAFKLEKLLESELGAIVRLTRRKDVFIPLAERTNLANDFDATIFISLHANASPGGKLSGVETYYLDNTGDKASEKLAERENRSVRFEGPQGDLAYMLSDLIQNAKIEDSLRLARSLQSSIFSNLAEHWQIGRSLGVKKGPFYVLVGAHMPCVLVEMGFIDNASDGKNLSESKFRAELAHSLFLGIKSYLGAKKVGA